MAGLVADYSSSSEEEKDDEELAEELANRITHKKSVNFFECPPDKKLEKNNAKSKKKALPSTDCELKKMGSLSKPLPVNALPSPFSDASLSSVFDNPFQKAQEDKKLVLEKHVKMTDNPKDVLEINGKKICWNYRKGRCKFGHNCRYAHDSDVIQQADQSPESKDIQESSVSGSISNLSYGELLRRQIKPNQPINQSYGELAGYAIESESTVEESDPKRKRRPGLSKGLVPSNKVLKMHRAQQVKERPWLVKDY